MDAAERIQIKWRGLNRNGDARGARGYYTLAEIAAITETYFRGGWQKLTVTRHCGPDGGAEIARIAADPETGRRAWWAECPAGEPESAVQAHQGEQ